MRVRRCRSSKRRNSKEGTDPKNRGCKVGDIVNHAEEEVRAVIARAAQRQWGSGGPGRQDRCLAGATREEKGCRDNSAADHLRLESGGARTGVVAGGR